MENVPAMDRRSDVELNNEIKEKAAGYTPQWRFNPEDPDVGTALASVFVHMQEGTIRQYNRMGEKHRSEFFNALGASMKPASPASGYVVFKLVNEQVDGVELPAGTGLTSSAQGDDGGAVPVETMEDLYVSPVRIKAIYESCDSLDYIEKLYEDSDENKGPFTLFGFRGENLQNHEFYIGHPTVFSVKTRGRIELWFSSGRNEPVGQTVLEALADPQEAEFSYSTEEGFIPFAVCWREGDTLILEKRTEQRAWEKISMEDQEMYWIRCRIRDGRHFQDFCFREAAVSSSASHLPAEGINANGTDSSLDEYFPFGEQFSIYNEVYFHSDEVFQKAGAMIQMSFLRDFVPVPLNISDSAQEMDWKLIMRKSQIRVEKEYDITIAEVIWEYFNGNGWVRLFPGKEYSQVFGTDEGTWRQRQTLCFLCPADMEPILAGGREGRCIRARILKINNAFKTQGRYISPLLSETRLEYRYPDHGPRPAAFITTYDLSRQLWAPSECLGQMYGFYPIRLAQDGRPAVYIGTDLPWKKGPLRLLWIMDRLGQKNRPPIRWEYEAADQWRDLNPADETEYFEQTGTVTFSGPDDWVKRKHFGREMYWLRLTDLEGGYLPERGYNPPIVEAFYENAVEAWTVRSGFTEYLTMERYQEHASFRLQNGKIYSLSLWELNRQVLPPAERETLKAAGLLRENRDGSGQVTETWIKWEERESLFASGRESRHYILDANEGILTFGDGARGKIPAPGILNGILVEYSIGAGEDGNLSEGQVNGLELDAGFINNVSNPRPFFGGYDRETAQEAMRRSAWELKHQFRAVTREDYEKLAMEGARHIQQVKCFGGLDETGKPRGGHVTLAVLPKDYRNQIAFFPEIRGRIEKFLKGKVPAGLIEQGRLHIVEPVMVEIRVSADVWVRDFDRIFRCRKEAEEALRRFLNPVDGNFDRRGWKIGTLPNRNQIDTVLRDMEDILDIRNLIIIGLVKGSAGTVEVSRADVKDCPYVLPQSGEHRIAIHVEQG